MLQQPLPQLHAASLLASQLCITFKLKVAVNISIELNYFWCGAVLLLLASTPCTQVSYIALLFCNNAFCMVGWHRLCNVALSCFCDIFRMRQSQLVLVVC